MCLGEANNAFTNKETVYPNVFKHCNLHQAFMGDVCADFERLELFRTDLLDFHLT